MINLHTNHRQLVGVATGLFLALSIVIAVLPAINAELTKPLAGIQPLSKEAQRGREIYLVEGCGTCHTQFVRAQPVDAPYGRGSVAGDYALEDPPMLGTQRTGPDLSNVGRRQPSEVWNLIHLYNPRAVVKASVMPSYPWYFEVKNSPSDTDIVVPVPEEYKPADKTIVATPDAIAIVRYLQSLKQVELPE